MTHDELLAKIDAELATNYADEGGNFPIGLNALRAVVELHKPVIDDWFDRGNIICYQCSNQEFTTDYRCPTIQAIEKELNNG